MIGTVLIRWNTTRATVCPPALLLALAISQAACNGPVAPDPVMSQPPPTATWTVLGFYTVTMTASPSCSLPTYAMIGTYEGARLAQSGQQLSVLFDPYGPIGGAFWGTIDGQNVRFTIPETGDPYVEDFIALIDGSEISYCGTASGKMDARRITATLNGTVRVSRQSDHSVIATCTASDHKMEMVFRSLYY